MSKYIKLFSTHTEYTSYIEDDVLKPNISYCEDNHDVYYNPYPRVIVKFNVTDISSPTHILCNYSSGISSILSKISLIEVDDIVQESVSNTYQFDTIGEHTIKYILTDPASMPYYRTTKYGIMYYYGMFYHCYQLTSVIIPQSVTNFISAFNGCDSLISVIIPNSITSIGDFAFYGCTDLTRVPIPNSVTSIGQYAFSGCGFTSLTIPNSVISIGEGCFQNSHLTNITIPSTITSIPNYTFTNCNSLTSVIIPNTVTRIGQDAFNGCKSLRNITFPSSVTSIGSGCIYNTQGTNVTIEATTPPGLGTPNGMNSASHIYVPSESVEIYKTATNWSTYASKIQAIPSS